MASAVLDMPTPELAYRDSIPPAPPARPLWKDVLLEFYGTFAFVYISLAGVNQSVLSGVPDQLAIAICFALGLGSGVVVADASGAHLNPAISATVFLVDPLFKLQRMCYYIAAQVLGGFGAGLLVLAVYYSWIDKEPEQLSLGSFGTLRNHYNSYASSIVDQFVGSALLMFGILLTPASAFRPIVIGAVLGGLGLFQGSNGFAFNLARDLGPRMASAIVFGADPFTAEDYWFWVPVVIPFLGVPFGWCMHKALKMIA